MPDPVTQAIAIDGGRRILAGAQSGRVLLFSAVDPGDRAEFKGLEGHAIRSLCISAGGGLIVAFNAAGRGLVWDRERRAAIDEVGNAGAVIQCAASGPGDYITLNNRGAGTIWSGVPGTLEAEPVSDASGVPLEFERFGLSEDGRRLTLLDGFRWRVWDRDTRAITASHRPIHGLAVTNLSGDMGLSANGRFYYAYWDACLVMDTTGASVVREHDVVVGPVSSALSDDGRVLVIGGEEGVVVVAGPDGKTIFDDAPGASTILQVSVGATGRLATFVDAAGGAGCIDIETASLLIRRERMAEIIG